MIRECSSSLQPLQQEKVQANIVASDLICLKELKTITKNLMFILLPQTLQNLSEADATWLTSSGACITHPELH